MHCICVRVVWRCGRMGPAFAGVNPPTELTLGKRAKVQTPRFSSTYNRLNHVLSKTTCNPKNKPKKQTDNKLLNNTQSEQRAGACVCVCVRVLLCWWGFGAACDSVPLSPPRCGSATMTEAAAARHEVIALEAMMTSPSPAVLGPAHSAPRSCSRISAGPGARGGGGGGFC